MSFKYWPYDELNVTYDKAARQLNLALPWIKIKAELESEDSSTLQKVVKRMRDGNVSLEDIDHFSELLENFKQYPISYILPHKKTGDTFEIADRSLLGLKPLEFLKRIGELEKESLDGINNNNIDLIRQSLGIEDFTWDANAATSFAGLEEKVHPESLLSVVRRYYMIDVVENSKIKSIYENIRELDKEIRVRAAAYMVRQNHYVTQRCLSAVSPALSTSKSAKPQVEEFISEESGHDALLGRSIQELGYKQGDLPVSINTKVTMDLLYFSAKRNFLAFAMIVDFFERSNYSDSDPLADLLKDCGMAKAAKFINIHMNINEAGGHELMSLSFLKSMNLCSPEYAQEAIALCELASVFMNKVAHETFKLFKTDLEAL